MNELFYAPELVLSTEFNEYLKDKVRNYSLSYSSMSQYQSCPRKFMLERLIGVPQEASKPLEVGDAVHKALEYFGNLQRDGSVVVDGSGSVLPDVSESMKRVGKIRLEKSVLPDQSLAEASVEVDQKIEAFSRDPLTKPPVMVEQFRSDIFFEGIRLSGKIDRIEAEGYDAKVYDFKTTTKDLTKKSKNSVMGGKSDETDYSSQLAFYDLLLSLDVRFLYQPVSYEFYFINNTSTKIVSIPREELDISSVKESIKEVYEGIRKLQFDKKAMPDRECQNCPFKNYCWENLPDDRYLFTQ
jgi:CRISPR/Cas system-associated exonuclease Cas4 (RecB family)